MNSNTLVIQSYIAAENDIELQLNLNSQIKINQMNKSSDDVSKIHDKYGAEEEYIRNQMDLVSSDKTSSEYQQLMSELNALEQEEDEKVEQIEKKQSIAESKIDQENSLLETRYEAMKNDRQGFEDARTKDIEQTFGYFQ